MTDMTVGSPFKHILKFSLPMLLSVAFQQMYNLADTIIAGKYIGENALAAVGVSFPITMLFLSIATGCNIGISVVVSQFFGAKMYNKVKSAISTAIISVCTLAVVLTVLGLIVCPKIVLLLNTPQNILADANIYLNIYIIGLLFLYLYNACNGIYVALGDSKTPLYFLIFSSVTNIALDLLFVVVFQWGVFGVAFATFLCQAVASVLSFLVLIFKLKKLKCGKTVMFSKTLLKKLTLISIPSILQQSFISVGNLLIQGAVNSFGDITITGFAAAIKINIFGVMCFTTLGNAISSFTAQNIGAGKFDRLHKGFKSGLWLIGLIILPISILNFIFAPDLMQLFLKEKNMEIINAGVLFLQIVTPFYAIISVKVIIDGILRGANHMKAFMAATFSDLLIRVVMAYILITFFIKSPLGIWVAWPIGWIIATIVSFYYYKKLILNNNSNK